MQPRSSPDLSLPEPAPAMIAALFKRIRKELETPRADRWFGSGWLSGCGALLAGIVAVILAVALKFPWLMMPELKVITQTYGFKIFHHSVLILGYVFALLSLLLGIYRMLPYTALMLVMLAALMGGSSAEQAAVNNTSIYFGLDFFVINVLFTGFLFIPLERFAPHRKDQIVFRPEWQEDMFYYLVSSLFVQVLTFLTLAPAQLAQTASGIAQVQNYIGSQPFVIQVLLIMLFTDFVQYWLHRAFHQVPWMWRFHAVHHSAKSMDWLAGARMHFLEIIVLRATTAIPMFSMGFDPNAIQAYILIVYVYSAFVHSNIGWDLTVVERFLVTPRFHHWHHGSEKEAIDVNYAIHFPLLDWLFGTHLQAEKRWPEQYGIVGAPMPRGYIRQFLYPFRKPADANVAKMPDADSPR
jgi:sterol desaturase/sphingolipid hydroxylase (fatty acid hydroxylase superfamily)